MKVLEVNDLTFSYEGGSIALDSISFNLMEGECLGIVGENGAGKSTLLYALSGLLKFTGKIFLFEMELNKKNLKKIRKKLGFVFQNPDDQLFMPTVYEDVVFGLKKLGFDTETLPKKVKEMLGKVNLPQFGKRSSHHLSYGEKKKVCLASVLIRNPELMLLDEPTDGLSPVARRDFIYLLEQIPTSKIIVSHDMNLMYKLCDTIIVLNNGKITCKGDSHKILADKNIMESNGLEIPSQMLIDKRDQTKILQ